MENAAASWIANQYFLLSVCSGKTIGGPGVTDVPKDSVCEVFGYFDGHDPAQARPLSVTVHNLGPDVVGVNLVHERTSNSKLTVVGWPIPPGETRTVCGAGNRVELNNTGGEQNVTAIWRVDDGA